MCLYFYLFYINSTNIHVDYMPSTVKLCLGHPCAVFVLKGSHHLVLAWHDYLCACELAQHLSDSGLSVSYYVTE